MKIVLGSDHGGFIIKEEIKSYLSENGIAFEDFGTFSEESVSYVPVATQIAKAVASKEYDRGILCCGTGIGVSIVANKFANVRAGVCTSAFCAEMARRHNDANVLCLGGRVISKEQAVNFTKIFLETPFEEGRHLSRLQEIEKLQIKLK